MACQYIVCKLISNKLFMFSEGACVILFSSKLDFFFLNYTDIGLGGGVETYT